MPHRQGIGAIYGIVTEDGAPARKRVVLLDRTTLSVVARTQSDENGSYAFTGLNPDTNDYLALAVDDDGIPCKEAICHDYIKPVPAHQGATFYGNWEKRVLRDYPLSGWLGGVDTGGNVLGLTAGVSQFHGAGLSVGESITPGAPHLPSLDILDACVAFGAHPDNLRSNANPHLCSLEWVFRRGSEVIGAVAAAAASAAALLTSSSFYMQAALRYDPATKKLTAYCRKKSGSDDRVATIADERYWRNMGSVDLSGAGQDVHAVLVIEYGFEARLYIDGALAETFSLGGFESNIPNNYGHVGVALVGNGTPISSSNSSSPKHTTGKTGVLAFYEKLLSAEDVAARYADLMVGTPPAETGFAKEVILDHPAYYYRLNDADASAGLRDWLTDDELRALRVYAPDKIAFSQPSPVAGQSAAAFSGGAGRTDFGMMQSASKKELTFEFFIQLTSDVTATQYVAVNTNAGNTIYSGVSVGAGNKLVLHLLEDTSAKTYTFAPALPVGEAKHVVIVLDKNVREARLYLDGVLADTQTTTATELAVAEMFGGTTKHSTHIAGLIPGAFNTVTSPLQATLGEVAFYSWALPASRIQAHFDAVTTL